jgi:N-acetylmuramoyl-L-alanine amidase
LLAQYLQRNILHGLRNAGYQSVDRGVKTDRSILRGGHFFLLGARNRYVARPSGMPAALGEALFMTNPGEAAQMRRPEIVDALARGYASGITQYLASR